MKIELIGEVADYYGEQNPEVAPLPKKGIVLSATEDELRAIRFPEMQCDVALVPAKTIVGNRTKLREALEKAKKAICHHAEHVCQSLSWENSDIQSNCADVLCAHRDLCKAKTAINAALAAPARNCDVGTVEEQEQRYEKFCDSHKWVDDEGANACMPECPLSKTLDCALAWAQMPYEKGGAE